jgi:hypothetical protein
MIQALYFARYPIPILHEKDIGLGTIAGGCHRCSDNSNEWNEKENGSHIGTLKLRISESFGTLSRNGTLALLSVSPLSQEISLEKLTVIVPVPARYGHTRTVVSPKSTI